MEPPETAVAIAQPARAPAVPRLALAALFVRFLRFGAFAWGGPVAQIAMIRGELVDGERWISGERFNRALAVYQVLPGPEAHELCCYFGYLSRGRIGALIAGLGFMAPGFVLMLALSGLYANAALGHAAVVAAFAGVQPAVAALIVRATHRIGRHALHRDVWLWAVAALSAIASVTGVHFAVPLAVGGVTFVLARGRFRPLALAPLAGLAALASAYLVQAPPGFDVGGPAEAANREPATALPLLISGLKSGLLTFGGAYTVIPFLRQDAVRAHGWLTDAQFLDGLGLAGVLPAPLVIFGTFVGFVSGGLPGSLAMTAGVFAPAFAFTIVGHHALERLLHHGPIHRFLDGVTAAVVGLIGATAVQVTLATAATPVALMTFAGSLLVLFTTKSRWATPALIVLAALIAGGIHVVSA